MKKYTITIDELDQVQFFEEDIRKVGGKITLSEENDGLHFIDVLLTDKQFDELEIEWRYSDDYSIEENE